MKNKGTWFLKNGIIFVILKKEVQMPTKEKVKKKVKKVVVYQCQNCGQKFYGNLTCPSCLGRCSEYFGCLFLSAEIKKGFPSKD